MLTIHNTQTMSSIELVKIINEMRDETSAKLRHDNFCVKIRKVLGNEAPKFLGVHKDQQDIERPCYYLPKRECHLMVMSESYKVQAAVYDRMAELEAGQVYIPQPEDQIRNALTFLEGAARMLNYSETSKIKGLTVIAEHDHLPTKMLPVYVEEVSVTRALGDLLRDHNSTLSAVRVNPLLETLGLQTRMTRRTSKGGTRNFWNITEAGLVYGKNEVCAQYPNETQPRWYVEKFSELLALIESQIPTNVVRLNTCAGPT